MHFLIFTGGDLEKGRAVEKALASFDKVIAVDSGASHCISYSLAPDFVVGDFDSIDEKTLAHVKSSEAKILNYPQEKDETDTHIAIRIAVEQGAKKISVLGGVAGDRIDHMLANILLPIQYTVPTYFVNEKTTLWLSKGPTTEEITGNKEDLLSLVPFSETVEGIQTRGLKYALENESLFLGKTRGVSNVFQEEIVKVTWKKGLLLIVHTSFA